MRVKKGFHWKSIEEKPDNWEIIRELIADGQMNEKQRNAKNEGDGSWTDLTYFRLFMNEFPDLSAWWKEDCDFLKKETIKKKVSSGKKQVSRKHAIHQKLEEERIKKEFQKFKMDEKTWVLIQSRFDFEVSHVLQIVWWNFMFYKKKKTPNKMVLLDAILSLYRISEYYEDRFKNINSFLRELVQTAKTRMNAFINDEMYSVLFNNPKLLVETSANKKGISHTLYPEQKNILDIVQNHVIQDKPLLLGNQMPTGTGKTFLTVPLAKRLSSLPVRKTLLFCCSNELVCQDVASTALLAPDDFHLWMAKLIQDEDSGKPTVLLRPYKRCFPSKWKNVYKNTDIKKKGSVKEQWKFYSEATGKTPDLIVCDLEAAIEIFRAFSAEENPFVGYIDEFVSDDESNEIVASLCRVLPKQTVLLSSILPKFENLSSITDHFCKRHDGIKEECIRRVTTADVNICCAIIDHEGYLRMPHHQCKNETDIEELVREIEVNPRIRRCYNPRHVYYWSETLESILRPHKLEFTNHFSNIGQIKTREILDYAVVLLKFLSKNPKHLDEFKKYRPKIFNKSPSKSELFHSQAYLYEGKTLYITENVMSDMPSMVGDLIPDNLKFKNLEQETNKKQAQYNAVISKLENSKLSKNSRIQEHTDLQSMYGNMDIQLPPSMVVNSIEHYNRYHPEKMVYQSKQLNRVSIPLSEEIIETFSDQMLLWILSGIGVYSIYQMTEYERNMVIKLYPKLAFLCSDRSIVFGTNLPHLTNIFIDEKFANHHPVSTLYQLMGRVGRMGRSYHANIILNCEKAVDKILSFHDNIDGEKGFVPHWIDSRFLELSKN